MVALADSAQWLPKDEMTAMGALRRSHDSVNDLLDFIDESCRSAETALPIPACRCFGFVNWIWPERTSETVR